MESCPSVSSRLRAAYLLYKYIVLQTHDKYPYMPGTLTLTMMKG